MIGKAIGILLALAGLLMLKFFPDMLDYQSPEFSKSGILIGLVLIAIGVVMIAFG
jgi:uncharacterized membrane protein (DUF441 family)